MWSLEVDSLQNHTKEHSKVKRQKGEGSIFLKFIFNWRFIALQYCVGFCHTTEWTSCKYTYALSPWNLQPTLHPTPPPGLSRSTLLSSLCYRATSHCSVAKLCPTLWDPVDCRPPGSSVHGIFQESILEWVAISISRISH